MRRYDDLACYRLNLITKYSGTEHILVGSEKSAQDMIETIKGMNPDSVVDWGDISVTAKDIVDFDIEETRFWRM